MGTRSVAVGFHPWVRQFRLLEAGLIIVGAISMLTILALRRDAAQGAAPTAASLQAVDSALRSIRSLTMVIGIDLMLAINTPL